MYNSKLTGIFFQPIAISFYCLQVSVAVTDESSTQICIPLAAFKIFLLGGGVGKSSLNILQFHCDGFLKNLDMCAC